MCCASSNVDKELACRLGMYAIHLGITAVKYTGKTWFVSVNVQHINTDVMVCCIVSRMTRSMPLNPSVRRLACLTWIHEEFILYISIYSRLERTNNPRIPIRAYLIIGWSFMVWCHMIIYNTYNSHHSNVWNVCPNLADDLLVRKVSLTF